MLNIQNARTGEQTSRMLKAKEDGLCPFCGEGLKIIHQNPVIRETENLFLTENAFPYEGTEHHFLIIPKEHVKGIVDLQEAHWREMSILFNWVCRERYIRDGSVFFRFGSSPHPTSSVEHLHIHLIVGNAKDVHSIDEVEPIKVKLAYKKR